MSAGLTPRMRQALDYIIGYMSLRVGVAPSYDEIGRVLDLHLRSSMARASEDHCTASEPVPERCSWPVSLLVDHRIRQSADTADLDFDRIAVLHPKRRITAEADPARRPGRDHVSRRERRER